MGKMNTCKIKKIQLQVVSELWPVKVGVVPPFKCARFASLNILRFVMPFRAPLK